MKLSYFPQMKVVHTSKVYHGQLYIPVANWLLMIGTILIASVYNNTTSLGNAYGVCVMFVTFFDTCMVSLAGVFVFRKPIALVLLFWLVIACLDGAYLSSALTKVPDGAWFTITLAIILACIFLLWRYGKEQQWSAEAEDRFPTRHFVVPGPDGELQLTGTSTSLSTFKGMGIYFDKAGDNTPHVFAHFVSKLTAIPGVVVFFHLRPLDRPSVAPEERHTVSKLAIANAYRVVVRYGYNDEVVSPDLAAVVYEQIRSFILSRKVVRIPTVAGPVPINEPAAKRGSLDVDSKGKGPMTSGQDFSPTSTILDSNHQDDEAITQPDSTATVQDSGSIKHDLDTLEEAYRHKVLYIVGKEQMKLKSSTTIVRRALLGAFLWLRDNTRNKIANLKIPATDLIEVGFLKEL